MIDSTKQYCYSAINGLSSSAYRLGGQLMKAVHWTPNLLVKNYPVKQWLLPLAEKQWEFKLNTILNVAHTVQVGEFSKVVVLLKNLINERFIDDPQTSAVDKYLLEVADAYVGCDLIKLSTDQIPCPPQGIGAALKTQCGFVCVQSRIFFLEKDTQDKQQIREIVLDTHDAHILKLKVIFAGIEPGQSRSAEVSELKIIKQASGCNIISGLEGVLRDYAPVFRKLEFSPYLKKKLLEAPTYQNNGLILFELIKTDPVHLSQTKKVINALKLLERALSNCEKLPSEFDHIDSVNCSIPLIQSLGPIVNDLYDSAQLLTHPDFNMSVFEEMFSFLKPMYAKVSSMLPLPSTLIPNLSEKDHVNLARKAGYGVGFAVNQLQPYEHNGDVDYAFLTEFGGHIPGYLNALSEFIQKSGPDLKEYVLDINQENKIDKQKLKALEKNALKLLHALDALRSGDLLASINVLNYAHIIRNTIDLTQAIFKELGHLTDSSQVTICKALHKLKYDGLAPLSSIFDRLQTELMLDSDYLSKNFVDLIGPWYNELISITEKVVDFSENRSNLVTLDEPRFVEARLESADREKMLDKQKIDLLDMDSQILADFVSELNTIVGTGTFGDHLKKKRLIEDYRVLQPYAEIFSPGVSNELIRNLNNAQCISTDLFTKVGVLRTKINEHLSQLKATREFHSRLVDNLILSVQNGVRDRCGLIKMDVDPTTRSFSELFHQLSPEAVVENLIILYRDKLYFANRKTKDIKEINKPDCTEDAQAEAIDKRYNFEKLVLQVGDSFKIAGPTELDLITSITGRLFRTMVVQPWPLDEKNIFDLDLSKCSELEQEQKLFLKCETLKRAKFAYESFLQLIVAYEGNIPFSVLDLDEKEILRKYYALFQPMLVSALRVKPDIQKIDKQLIHALSGKKQTFNDPLVISTIRSLSTPFLEIINSKLQTYEAQLKTLEVKNKPSLVKSNALLSENKTLEERERYLIKDTLGYAVVISQLKEQLENLFDVIEPCIRSTYLIAETKGLPYPELEDKTKLFQQPAQVIFYKQLKNALYYLEQAKTALVDLKDVDKPSFSDKTYGWLMGHHSLNLIAGVQLDKLDSLLEVKDVLLNIYNAYDLISTATENTFLPGASNILDLFKGACEKFKKGIIEPLYPCKAWGLIRTTSDPMKMRFKDIEHALKFEEGIISYANKLYYLDRKLKKVKKVELTENNQDNFSQLNAKCSDKFKLADQDELILIAAVIGKAIEKEEDPILLGLNALMSAPEHFKQKATLAILDEKRNEAKKDTTDIWRIALDSSNSFLKLLGELPTCYALVVKLKEQIKTFAKEGNQVTKRNLEAIRDDYFIPLLIEADAHEERYCLQEGLLTQPLVDRFDAFYKEFLGRLGLPAEEHLKILRNVLPYDKRIEATQKRMNTYPQTSQMSYYLAGIRGKIKLDALNLAKTIKNNQKDETTAEYIELVLLRLQEHSQGEAQGFSLVKKRYDHGLKEYIEDNKASLMAQLVKTTELDSSIKRAFENTVQAFNAKDLETYKQLESLEQAVIRLERYIQNAEKGFFLSRIESYQTLANKKQILVKLKNILSAPNTRPKEHLQMVHNFVSDDMNFRDKLLEQGDYDLCTFSTLFQIVVTIFEACIYIASFGLYTYKSEREQCYQAFNQTFFKRGNLQDKADDACTMGLSPLKSGI